MLLTKVVIYASAWDKKLGKYAYVHVVPLLVNLAISLYGELIFLVLPAVLPVRWQYCRDES